MAATEGPQFLTMSVDLVNHGDVTLPEMSLFCDGAGAIYSAPAPNEWRRVRRSSLPAGTNRRLGTRTTAAVAGKAS